MKRKSDTANKRQYKKLRIFLFRSLGPKKRIVLDNKSSRYSRAPDGFHRVSNQEASLDVWLEVSEAFLLVLVRQVGRMEYQLGLSEYQPYSMSVFRGRLHPPIASTVRVVCVGAAGAAGRLLQLAPSGQHLLLAPAAGDPQLWHIMSNSKVHTFKGLVLPWEMAGSYTVNVPKLEGRENYECAFAAENFLILEGVDINKQDTGDGEAVNVVNNRKAKGFTRSISLLRNLISILLENSESMTADVTQLIDTAQNLRGTGSDINEEWIGSLLLAGLPDKFSSMIMALEHSGLDISADVIKTKLLDMSDNVGSGESESASS
ncbi:hypothetical protein EVAR_30077_1 [Eumeta japonica]|uniref:Uncharacterized protein n=1 Tax=Eumeta variegata TaxID=151549 RepID=A0A4C1X7P4_EUMVA|nr:hypothetical protein EVAR_30077_1 [Eumeta japonica]